MSKTLATALLGALLLTPLANAGWFGDDVVTIEVPHLRVGDRMLYAQTYAVATDGVEGFTPRDMETVQLVEGVGTARDAYGIPRAVETVRMEGREGGERVYAVRCHRLAGGEAAVRVDMLDGETWDHSGLRGGDPLMGEARREVNMSVESHYGGSCAPNTFGGRAFREGDRIPFGALSHGGAFELTNLSQPAAATKAHGRDALVFRFLASDLPARGLGDVEIVLADGLPGVYAHRAYAPQDASLVVASIELRGIERGDGPELAPFTGAAPPERNPNARFAPPAPFHLDDAPYRFALPFAAAMAALRDDPQERFEPWAAAHPDAVLLYAGYEADAEVAATAGVTMRAKGSWIVTLRDGPDEFTAYVVLRDGVGTPVGPLGVPALRPEVLMVWASRAEDDAQIPSPGPFEVADARSLAAAAAGAGVPPESVRSYGYSVVTMGEETVVFVGLSTLSSEDDGAGRMVYLDATRGALGTVLSGVARTTYEGGILAPASGTQLAREDGGVSALSALAGPGPGSGLAVGGAAATGLALLLLFLKLVVVPLFTRLRKDRLLDNPVRARLFERIRAEPGIHLAALTEFAGIGKGATRHHVDQLVKHRFVIEAHDGHYTRYFAAGEVPPDVARREVALRSGNARRVYDAFAAEPHLSLREAAARLGVSAPAVHRVKKRLESHGLLPAAPQADVRPAEA